MHTTCVGTARHASMSWVTRCAMRAFAHPTSYPGSPNTFFNGEAGPYPVHVTVRLPGVIPGLAQIADLRAFMGNVGLLGSALMFLAIPQPWEMSLAGLSGALRAMTRKGRPIRAA